MPLVEDNTLTWVMRDLGCGSRYGAVDIVSAIEFDETGEFLAVGDRGGRVVVFEQDAADYKFYAEFQSHEPEFDYLKSLEIEEKINKIKWCRRTNDSHFLLTTNGK